MNFLNNFNLQLPLKVGCLLLPFLLVSCGKGFKEEEEEVFRQNEEVEELFNISFSPLNATKIGRYHGWSGISIADNQIWIRVKLQGPSHTDAHAQYLHTGSRCPTMADDRNNDGYLDFMEVSEVVGPVLLPFDGNLNSQLKGLHDFPTMKREGMYYYSEAGNYSFLLEDLEREDMYPADMITKLDPREELDLSSRVVLIYGVDGQKKLPNSVATFDGYPSQATLPIACGVVRDGATTEKL